MHRCVRGYPYGASPCLEDVCGLLDAGTDCWQLPQVARVPAEVLVGVLPTAVQHGGSPHIAACNTTALTRVSCATPLSCQVDTEVGFGEVASVELLPGGAATKVTTSNRQQYVSLYCCHLLEASIQRQFGAFKRGFHRLCSGAALKMFRWVCGGCGRHAACHTIAASGRAG